MYSDTDILAAIECGKMEISDFDKAQLGSNSYDVKLGRFFFEVIWGDDGPWFVGPLKAERGQRVYVPVGGTLLAMTQARIRTSTDVVGMMKARSTPARTGITVCKCAGLGDVGYDNHWTMELSAFIRIGRPFVTPGEMIAQIAFFETKSDPTKPYSGQYRLEDWPLCMVPKDHRHRIIPHITDMPGLQTSYVGGKITAEEL